MKYWEIEFECDDFWSVSGIYSFFMRQESEPTIKDIQDVHGVQPNNNGLGNIVRVIDITDELEDYEAIPDEWYVEWLANGNHTNKMILNVNMLEKLVGRRYENLDLLKNDIEVLSGKKVNAIFESESEVFADLDYMIDYEFEEMDDIYTLYYLKDNANNYYITEV